MKYFAVSMSVVLLLLSSGASARDYFEDRGYWYLFGERYTWRQFDGGDQITKDVGENVGIGALGDIQIAEDTALIGRLRGEGFGGKGNFDAATGPGTKASSTTTGYGLRAEGDLGWRFQPGEGKTEILPFAGLGYRWWKTKVKESSGIPGFEETWNSMYSKIGARGVYFLERNISIFGEAGVKVPVYTQASSSVSVGGSTSYKPGSRISGFLEAGVNYKGVRPSLYYEGSRFSESRSSGGVTYPETEGDILGVRVAFEF